jgi:hypothetical protein
MGFFRRIEGLFQKPKAGSVSYTEEESKLRYQQLLEDPGKFAYDEDGFTYTFSDGPLKIRWDQVSHIDTYKRDHLTTDEVCLDIFWQEWKMTIGEDTPGWHQFVSRMTEVFPQIPEDWWDIVVQPPFAANFRTIYQRSNI